MTLTQSVFPGTSVWHLPYGHSDGEGDGQEALAKVCRVHKALTASPTLPA